MAVLRSTALNLHRLDGHTNIACLRILAINALRLTGHTNIAAGLRNMPERHSCRCSPLVSHDDFAEALRGSVCGCRNRHCSPLGGQP